MPSEWVVGICGCFTDMRTCLDHLFCTPCMLSRHMHAVDGERDTCAVPSCCAAICFGPIILLLTRRKIVEKYHLNEGCCNSFGKCCLCGPLLTCQNHYELTRRGLWPGPCVCDNSSVSVANNMAKQHCEKKRRSEEKKRQESPAEDPAPQQQKELPQHGTSPQGQIPTPRQHDTIQIPYGPPAVTHPYDQGTSTGMTYQV